MLIVLVSIKYKRKCLKFFLLKKVKSFSSTKSYSYLKKKKNASVFEYDASEIFNASLTNEVISLEQLGPGVEILCATIHS